MARNPRECVSEFGSILKAPRYCLDFRLENLVPTRRKRYLGSWFLGCSRRRGASQTFHFWNVLGFRKMYTRRFHGNRFGSCADSYVSDATYGRSSRSFRKNSFFLDECVSVRQSFVSFSWNSGSVSRLRTGNYFFPYPKSSGRIGELIRFCTL